MLKPISAALIAASMLTAPALAATVIKTERGPVTKTVVVKPSVANANAKAVTVKKVQRHHHRKFIRYHRAHKHMGAVVTKKVIVKRVSSTSPAVKHIVVKKKV